MVFYRKPIDSFQPICLNLSMEGKNLSAPLKSILPEITSARITQLEKFVELVLQWNQRVNLISRKDVKRIWEHHVVSSLLPLRLLKFPADCQMLDIGSGGGFPAIPIKIARPDMQMVLVDSIRKKALFLKKVISELSLSRIIVINERIETLQQSEERLRQFDIVTARAVTDIPQLIKWGSPFLKPGGKMILWKGEIDIPELEHFAGLIPYRYLILHPPEEIIHQFPNLKETCWFVIEFSEGSKG